MEEGEILVFIYHILNLGITNISGDSNAYGFICLRSRMCWLMKPASLGDEAVCIYVSTRLPFWQDLAFYLSLIPKSQRKKRTKMFRFLGF